MKDLKARVLVTMDKHGLYKAGTDNPILYTVQFYCLCKRAGLFDEEDLNRLHRAINSLQVIPGLYNRRPGLNTKKDQHDNYCAIASTVMFGKEFEYYSRSIDDYGAMNHYSYDNRNPLSFSFDCWRQGYSVFFYRACAGRYTGLFNYLWFIGKIWSEFHFRGKEKSYTSSHLLSWLRFEAIGHKWYVKPIYRYWKRKIRRKYRKGLAEAIGIYHGNTSILYEMAINDNKL